MLLVTLLNGYRIGWRELSSQTSNLSGGIRLPFAACVVFFFQNKKLMQFLNKVNIHGPSSCKELVHIYLSFTVSFSEILKERNQKQHIG